MSDQIRFTPDEIKALLRQSDIPITDLMPRMHPDDRKLAVDIFNSGDYGDPGLSPGDQAIKNAGEHPGAAAMFGAGAAVPLATGGAIGAAGAAVPGIARTAGGIASLGGTMWGIGKLGNILHMPSELTNMLQLGAAFAGNGSRGSGSAPAPVNSVEQELEALKARGRKISTGTMPEANLPPLSERMFKRPQVERPQEAILGGDRTPVVGGVPHPEANVPRSGTMEEINDLVKKGVTNDFKGRVHIDPNAAPTRRTPVDPLEQHLTDSYGEGALPHKKINPQGVGTNPATTDRGSVTPDGSKSNRDGYTGAGKEVKSTRRKIASKLDEADSTPSPKRRKP